MTRVAAYPLDEGSGTTAVDIANGHNLTVSNATWTTGKNGSALQSTASNVIGASSTIPAITTNVTLMCWVKPLSLASGGTNFACGIIQSNGNTDCAIFAQRGSFGTGNVLQADVRINGGLVACNGTGALTVNTYDHVAVSYDGSAIKLYKNAVLMTTTSISGTISFTTSFYVAGAIAAATLDVNNAVDEPQIFDQALDQATIASYMNTALVAGNPRGGQFLPFFL